MEPLVLVFIVGAVLFTGVLGRILFSKIGLPEIFWLLVAGLVLGPLTRTFRLSELTPMSGFVSSFAIVVLLFEAGIQMKITTLLKHGLKGISFGMVRSILAFAMVTAIIMATGYGVLQSILMGLVLSGLSFAVLIPLALRLGNLSAKAKAVLAITSMTDNFTVILAFAVIDAIKLGLNDPSAVLTAIAGSFSTGIMIGAIAGVFAAQLMKEIESKELTYFFALSSTLMLYAVTEYMNASGPVAVFFFGLVIGNFQKLSAVLKHKEERINLYSITAPHKITSFFMRTFFFVFLGAVTKIENLSYVAAGGLIALMLVLVQKLSLKTLSLFGTKLDGYDLKVMPFMVPVGLSAAIMANFIFASGVPGTEGFTDIIFVVILVTLLITTGGVYFAEKSENARA